jgi:DNA-directed RNA polymerase subunit RPC12/RpoP
MLPFVVFPLGIGGIAVTAWLLPAIAFLPALIGFGYMMLVFAKAFRARVMMLYWNCPKCSHRFVQFPYIIRVFSDNRCGHCGARVGEG